MVALPQSALAATPPGVTFTKLTLLNGWSTYSGSATPAIADISGIVYFKGAISTSSSNTNDVAFVLPPGFRPAKYVNVPVDMCNATSGELNIAKRRGHSGSREQRLHPGPVLHLAGRRVIRTLRSRRQAIPPAWQRLRAAGPVSDQLHGPAAAAPADAAPAPAAGPVA